MQKEIQNCLAVSARLMKKLFSLLLTSSEVFGQAQEILGLAQ